MRQKTIPLYLTFAVPFILQVLGIVSLVGYLSHRSGQKAVTEMIDQVSTETRHRVTHELDHYLTLPYQVNRLQINAVESGAINLNQLDVFHRYLIGQHRQFSDIADLGFATPEGEFLVSHSVNPIPVGEGLTQAQLKDFSLLAGRSDPSNPSQLKLYTTKAESERIQYLKTVESRDVRQRYWYRQAVATQTSGWTKPFQEEIDNYLMISAYTPFYDETNTLEGVFFASLNLEALSQFLSNLSLNKQGEVFIIDRNGFLVATSSGESPRTSADESAHPILKQVTQRLGNLEEIQSAQVIDVQVDQEKHFLQAVPYQDDYGLDWLVITVVPEAAFMGEINGNLRRTVGLCLFALVGSLGLGWWSSRGIARSLRSMSEASQDMAKGNFQQPLPETKIQELDTLRQSFQEMAQSLQTAKAFQENYQHRLEQEVKEQTAALRQREAQLQVITDSIPGCIAYTDSSLRYQFVNQTYEEWFHCRKEDILGERLPDVIGEEAYRRVQTYVERALAGETVTYEAQLPYQGGKTRYISATLVPDCDEAGTVQGYYALITDITAQKQAEYKLEAKTKELERFFSLALDLLLIADTEGYVVHLNQQWEKTLGYPLSKLEGKQFLDYIHPEDLASTLQAMRYLRQGGKIINFINRYCRQDSSYRSIEWHAIRSNDLIYAVGRDITERKRAEQTLQIKEAHLRKQLAMIEAAANGIGILEGETYSYLNPAHLEMFGYDDPEELLGKSWRILYPPDEIKRLETEVFPIIQRDGAWHGETIGLRKDGSMFPVEVSLTVNEEGWRICICQDITARKETEQQLIAARKAAEKAAQYKSEFLATMSHEIRTPINGVIGMLQVLQNSDLTPKQRSRLDVAYASANSLLTLINDILDFSKVDAGKLNLETTPFSLREHLENFAQTMALPAQEKGLELVLDLSNVPPRMIKGDPSRLRQILTNLVSNAIKFTEAGEILIQCQLQPVGDRLCFTGMVQDTGVGIREDKLNSLFEPFTQADASTTRKYGGTGLGLTIVKKLCHLMQGNVSVESQVGKGSCFTFNVMLEATAKPPQPAEKLNDITVLVVAKNQSHRQALARQFQAWGVTAITAEQGKTALSLTDAEASAITIALIDYHLPDQPGIELAQGLQKRFDLSKSQIMLMTPINYSEQFQPSNSTIYCTLTKPIVPSALWQAITSSKAEPFSQHQSEALTAEESIASTLPALRILLVEDDQMNQLVFKAMMEPYTLQVDIARHGKEALQRLQTASSDHPYHLVLMDCQMPEMDGYETTRQIRTGVAGEPYQTVPIIAMTAYAMAGDPEKCFTAGMDDYMSKPLTQEKVMTILAKWSENAETRTSEDAINAQAFQNLLAAIGENNSEVIVQLLQGTQEDVQQLVESIIPMLERGQNSDAQSALHSLKGKSLTIGAFGLGDACQQMELILEAGKMPDSTLIQTLEAETKKLLQAIMIKLQAYN